MTKFPFVITLPHCSARIPHELQSSYGLNEEEIWESLDLGTEEIFGSLPAAAILRARWSRLVVDLNRGPDQRDPKGVIAQVDYHGRAIYKEGCIPDENEFQRRLMKYYRPFHRQIRKSLELPSIKGLFDCHSLYGIGPPQAPDPGKKRCDIILGNNDNHREDHKAVLGNPTCPSETMEFIKAAFERAGFSVAKNDPYGGGFITTHYGQKLSAEGKFAIQIELNQNLYMDPNGARLVPENLKEVSSRISWIFHQLASRL